MSRIALRRRKDTGALRRSIEVLLNDDVVAELRRGTESVVDVEPGRHEVRAQTINFGSDVEVVDVAAGQTVRVEVWLSILSLNKATYDPEHVIKIRQQMGPK